MKNKNTVKINIDNKEIEVDIHCAEMVQFLNEVGMKTKMCCQGHEKDIYRIWFDVTDEQMEDFIKKTSMWTEVGVRPTNEEKTEFEIYRYQRGLQGWLFKRHFYINNKLNKVWVYQAEGYPGRPAHLVANKDLISMKAIFNGTKLQEIQSEQERLAEIRLNKLLKCQQQNIELQST